LPMKKPFPLFFSLRKMVKDCLLDQWYRVIHAYSICKSNSQDRNTVFFGFL
jgi:hypothetical protein